MSLTLSPPVRVVVFVGALVLTGLAAVVFLLGRGVLGGSDPVTATPTVQTARPKTSAQPALTPRVAQKPSRPASGFPARIDHALRYSRVVVVSVSMPGAPVDAVVRREARAAAKASHAAFVPLSALNERAAEALVAKAGLLPDPAVLIVKRPGVVSATFSVTDAATIAQAVAEARR